MESRDRIGRFKYRDGVKSSLSLAAFDLIVLTSLIQVSLALPMSFYFHRMAMLGLPTNMAIVPLTGVLMPIGIAATLISYISPMLAKLPVMLTALTLHAIVGTVQHYWGMWRERRDAADARAAEAAPKPAE